MDDESKAILREISDSLRVLPELVQSVRSDAKVNEHGAVRLSRLEKAMILMFRMPNPSARGIAKAMGYRSHSSLYKIDGFEEILDRYKQFLAYTGPSMRSVVDRKNSDWTGEDDL